jgi:hypothetical protein
MRILLRIVGLLALLFLSALARAECVPGSSTTTFNASHDLHKVTVDGVQFPNAKPNDDTIDSAPRLNAAILHVSGVRTANSLHWIAAHIISGL